MSEPITYLGVKQVNAVPMSVEEPNQYPSMSGQVVGAEGYEVTYEDGYKSWSPKAVFDAAYRPISGLSIGLAIEALNRGDKVSRTGWGNTGIFVTLAPEADTVQYPEVDGDGNPFTPSETMLLEDAMKRYDITYGSGEVIHDWLPSHIDLQSDDWYVVVPTA